MHMKHRRARISIAVTEFITWVGKRNKRESFETRKPTKRRALLVHQVAVTAL